MNNSVKINKYIILLLVPFFMMSACKTYVPFTKKLKTDNKWSENDLKKIQFYLSNTIVLHRQLGSSETKIESGVIKTVDGKLVEEIVIRKGTPGVVVQNIGEKKMTVSFEIADDYFLTFGAYQNRGGRYYLMLKDYKKDRWSKVTYVGKEFYISPESLHAFLQIDMKKILKEERNQRVAGGRKL